MPVETHIAIQELAEEFGWMTRQLFPEYKRLKFRVYHHQTDDGWSLASDMASNRQDVQPIINMIIERGLTEIYVSYLVRDRAPVKDDKPLTPLEVTKLLQVTPGTMIKAAWRAVRLRGGARNPVTVIHG